jgi:hypothetical protein
MTASMVTGFFAAKRLGRAARSKTLEVRISIDASL